MSTNKFQYELIVINDGSRDSTYEVLKDLSNKIKELIIINLRKNYGQTAAMAAGFDIANGQIVISLDGDLQNDPNDIPRLVVESLGINLLRSSAIRTTLAKHVLREEPRKLERFVELMCCENTIESVISSLHLHNYRPSTKFSFEFCHLTNIPQTFASENENYLQGIYGLCPNA